MRLIDADALAKKVELYEKAISKGREWEEFKPTHQVLAKVRRLILQAQTIEGDFTEHLINMGYNRGLEDAIVHAHWKSSEQGTWCSRCRVESIFEYDYCPNCGARMDGE